MAVVVERYGVVRHQVVVWREVRDVEESVQKVRGDGTLKVMTNIVSLGCAAKCARCDVLLEAPGGRCRIADEAKAGEYQGRR